MVALAVAVFRHPGIASQPMPVRVLWIAAVCGSLSLILYYTLWTPTQVPVKSVQPATFSENPEIIRLTLGGVDYFYPFKQLQHERVTGLQIEQPIHTTLPISTYVEGDTLYADVAVRGATGNAVELQHNVVKAIPAGWDYNYNDYALEIVSDNQFPVYQFIYERPNHIKINGIFLTNEALVRVWDGGIDAIRNDEKEAKLPPRLKRIFKYPSWQHRGEYAEPSPLPSAENAPISQSQLDITFDESGKGFVHPFRGESLDPQSRSIVDYKLYRVAVISSLTCSGTRLRVVDLELLDGVIHPSLSLRITGDREATEFKLHAGIPQMWDVVEKPVGNDWMRLIHTVKTVPPLILRAPCSFRIVASCDQGFSISKLVELDVDSANNNELTFRLEDI